MDESLYHAFAAIEEHHWWFVARRRIIADQVVRVLRLVPGSTILDAGCGTGGVLRELQKTYRVSGMDMSETAVRFCHESGLKSVRVGTFENDPFSGERYDCILMLDVIEHIPDDVAALRAAREKLTDQGRILITVPAYQFLWSSHDELNHHQRRYDRRLLLERIKRAGFVVERATYFNTFLFPIALIQRLLARVTRNGEDATLQLPSRSINATLERIFGAERIPLRRLRFPFGLSLLAVARKGE